jgi:hypothetical protein
MNDSAGRLERAQVERLLAGAMTAPSADNCQPWTFQWTGRELAVRYDRERGQHHINHGLHAAYITLGSLLEALSMAASAEALRTEETLQLETPESATWATVRFSRGATTDTLAGGWPTAMRIVGSIAVARSPRLPSRRCVKMKMRHAH